MQYIQGIEASDFNMPLSLAPTFYEETTFSPGNNFIDFTLVKYEYDPINVVVGPEVSRETFTIEFDVNERVASKTELFNLLRNKMNAAFVASSNPEMNNAVATVQPFFGDLPDGIPTTVQIRVTFTAEANRTGAYIFLFGSGPNANRSAWKVFGFAEGVDTPLKPVQANAIPGTLGAGFIFFDITTEGALGTRIIQRDPLRYIDVRVPNVDSSLSRKVPVTRIFLQSALFINNGGYLPNHTRLLTTPLPYQDDLNIQLVMEDDVQPNPSAANGWHVTFDLLLVSPENCIPNWIKFVLEH